MTAATSLQGPRRRLRANAWYSRVPVRDRCFWWALAATAGVTIFHVAFCVVSHQRGVWVGHLTWMTLPLYIGPLALTARRFGTAGMVPVLATVAVLSLPCLLLDAFAPELPIRLTELALVGAIGLALSLEADRDRRASLRLTSERASRKAVQQSMIALAEHNVHPVMVSDDEQRVVEANAAADRLFDCPLGGSRGRPLAELLPRELLGALDGRGGAIGLRGRDAVRWLRPVSTALPGDRTQVIFVDETDDRRHRDRLAEYSARMIQTQEEERKRVSREIHDGTLQSLILLSRKVEAIAIDAASGSASAVQLQGVQSDLDAAVRTLRALARGLRPPFLDDLGVAAALDRLAVDVATASGIDVRLCVDDITSRLDPALELAIYRIAQEALSNVVRHSRADAALVSLRRRPNGLRLLVADNGSGFTPEHVERGVEGDRGLGLLGMRERARVCGGVFKLRSAPGRGTVLAVRFVAVGTRRRTTTHGSGRSSKRLLLIPPQVRRGIRDRKVG